MYQQTESKELLPRVTPLTDAGIFRQAAQQFSFEVRIRKETYSQCPCG